MGRASRGSRRAWWDPERWQVHPPPLLHPLPARSASTPETWARFTQENLQRAERERLASFNLRGLIDCILRDTSEDLRLQCDSVNLAFGRRLEELEDARHKLEHHLNKVRQCAPATPRPVQASPRVWVPTARERPGSCAPPPLATMPWSGPGLAPAPSLPLHPEGPQRRGLPYFLHPH